MNYFSEKANFKKMNVNVNTYSYFASSQPQPLIFSFFEDLTQAPNLVDIAADIKNHTNVAR